MADWAEVIERETLNGFTDVHLIPDEFKVEKLAANGILLVVFDYAEDDISE